MIMNNQKSFKPEEIIESFNKYGEDFIFIDIDNVKLQKSHSDYNNLNKFLQKFINISEININILFPTTTKETSYFMEYFNIIKNIVKLNNEIKIKFSLPTLAFPFDWLEDIFEDIIIENIKTIHISYQHNTDSRWELMGVKTMY